MATSVRGRQVNAFQALALLLAFVLIATVGGLLTAGLLLPGVAVANGATDLTVTAFDDLPDELEGLNKPLSEKSVMLAADGSVLATFYLENRIVVPSEQIAQIMKDAVVATEDKRFFEHGGIDPTGMLRATVKTLAGDKEGASTLTQQYVKNVLLEAANRAGDTDAAAAATTAEGTEGISRKLREAKLAIALEKVTPKEKILEGYLNIAQFGIGLYGVETASQYYFSKPASDLNYLEAATIAGITQAPSKWDPVAQPEQATERRFVVLGLMLDQGYITRAEYDAGIATPLADTLHIQQTKLGCASAGEVVPGSGYFCDYVTKVIANHEAFGATKDERTDLLYRGGLTITTTLDPRIQSIADAQVKAGIPVGDPSGIGSAISVVQPGTGQIQAMAQNRNYSNTSSATETSVNWNADFQYGAGNGFPPGSTFKPFTLVEWLKQGHSLREQVNGSDASKKLNSNQFTACGARLPSQEFSARNSEGGGGMMSILDATQNSVNRAYWSMAMQLDLCDIMNGAAALGVTKSDKAGYGQPFDAYASNVIGSNSASPLAMAGAFATFASGGTFCKPVAITKVVDTTGAEIPVPQADCTKALEDRVANAVNYALSNVWDGTASKVGRPAYTSAGKTGTTSENEHTWFVGYTPVLAAAVWVGYPEGWHEMQNIRVNGGPIIKNVYGATFAAPTWKRVMDEALAGQEIPAFGAVGSNELNGVQVGVPYVVGQSVDAATARLRQAGFSVSVAPEQVDSWVPAGSVAEQSPSGSASKGANITLTLSNGRGGGNNDQLPQPNPGNGNGRP